MSKTINSIRKKISPSKLPGKKKPSTKIKPVKERIPTPPKIRKK